MTDASGAVRRAEDFVRSYPTLAALLLLLPLFLLLIAFFVVPLLQLLNLSLLAQHSAPASFEPNRSTPGSWPRPTPVDRSSLRRPRRGASFCQAHVRSGGRLWK